MKTQRNPVGLTIITGLLPLFFILALIAPLWMYYSAESFFLDNLLKFAEVEMAGEKAASQTPLRLFILLIILYLPAVLFAFALWQGMKVTQSVKQRRILSLPLARSVRKIAIAMLGMGILLPVCRFLIPLVVYWPQRYFQVTILLSDFVLLLVGGLLFVTFHSMLEGIKAEEENKEFV